jgi:hypothetical protein
MVGLQKSVSRTSRGVVALVVVGLLLLVGLLAVLFLTDDLFGGRNVATPDVTADLPGATLDASPIGTAPTASASPLASSANPVVSPGATPMASPGVTPLPPLLTGQCREGCMVRVPRSDLTVALLKDTGERPSYESDAWLWTIVSAKTLRDFQAKDVPVFLVRDSPETLYLYATRLPKDQSGSRVVREFGDVLDSVDGHSIVRVDDVPANVSDVIAARVWVEKVKPAAPGVASRTPAGTGEPISEVHLGVLLPEVDAEEIEQTIAELQEMSSTDGTGIGTRHYTSTGNVMAAEYLFTRLESYGLTVWYEDFVTPEGLLSTNVIGELPGQDPGSIYAVMAHLDTVAADFSSAPGADDNATGVAAALEIARILSGYELKYPVHIILVNAEETAILGSDAYARDPMR